nr:hypothetical protein [Streptomyces atratus]
MGTTNVALTPSRSIASMTWSGSKEGWSSKPAPWSRPGATRSPAACDMGVVIRKWVSGGQAQVEQAQALASSERSRSITPLGSPVVPPV